MNSSAMSQEPVDPKAKGKKPEVTTPVQDEE